MGLGDVYLGAPVATPLDPRHRLVTTKYNPARTWTPENAVGIGGAYLCVYGMEGPGGYQFVGRTVQMWNRYRTSADFRDGKHWLLRFFDQIRFYPVSADELLRMRAGFSVRAVSAAHRGHDAEPRRLPAFLERERASIEAFRDRQRAAFEAERERWRAAGHFGSARRGSCPPSPRRRSCRRTASRCTSPVSRQCLADRVDAGQQVADGEDALVSWRR